MSQQIIHFAHRADVLGQRWANVGQSVLITSFQRWFNVVAESWNSDWEGGEGAEDCCPVDLQAMEEHQ